MAPGHQDHGGVAERSMATAIASNQALGGISSTIGLPRCGSKLIETLIHAEVASVLFLP
jgi:hypothetical protein